MNAYPQHQPGIDSFDDSMRIQVLKKEGGEISGEHEKKDEALAMDVMDDIDKPKMQRDKTFSDSEIEAAFRFIDLDKNGYIGANEIRHILICMGEMITDEEVDMMINMVDSDGDGHFRHVHTDIQFQRDPYAVTDRLRKERKDAEAELYGDVTFEVDPDLDFKRRSNHSDLHHGNWDHEYHKVKRETDAELERAHPKVESPRQGIRYGRRRLPSHIRPNHNGGVI